MTRPFLIRILTVALFLAGASGLAVQMTGVEEVVGGQSSVDVPQPAAASGIRADNFDGPGFSMSQEHRSAAPELFFESEEEVREEHLPSKVTTKASSVSTHIRSLASEPSVFSLNDLSSVVGCGRNFHVAPPLRIVFGVFRI